MASNEDVPLEQVARYPLGDGDVAQIITFGDRLTDVQLKVCGRLARRISKYVQDQKLSVSLIEIGPEDNVSQLKPKYSKEQISEGNVEAALEAKRQSWRAVGGTCHFCAGPAFPWLCTDETWALVESRLGQQQACFECFVAAYFLAGHTLAEPFQVRTHGEIAALAALRSRGSSDTRCGDPCPEAPDLDSCLLPAGHGGEWHRNIPSSWPTGSSDTRKAARPEHPGPPDVPGQEQCGVCGGFLGDDAYGHHSRMCRCERGSSDTRLTEALRERDGWMRHAETSDKEVTSLRAIFPHPCDEFLVVEEETDTSDETTWCPACHHVGMLVHAALQQGVPLPGALGRLADDLPSSGLRDEIAALAALRSRGSSATETLSVDHKENLYDAPQEKAEAWCPIHGPKHAARFCPQLARAHLRHNSQ